MQESDLGFVEAQEQIQEAKATSAIELTLADLGLRELPPELADLDQLEQLDLQFNQLTEIPEYLFRLQNLTTLYLGENQLTEIPKHLFRLQNLTVLDLSGNKLAKIPKHLSKLQNLTELYLGESQLTEIPKHLSQLQNLTTLYLGENQLTEIPEHLSKLQNLTRLSLSNNQLTEIPEHLSKLQSLTVLDLSGNKLAETPKHLSKLQNLTELYLEGSHLTEISQHLFQLQNLTTLDLSRNQLTEIPENLSRLDNLIKLNLCNNKLTKIPEHLSRLQNMTTLDLARNQLIEIPEHLSQSQNLTTLDLRINPIQNPPYEVCQQGIEAIREYYRQLRDVGEAKLYEAKLLIVGEPGAGKTTLAQKIHNPDYSLKDESSTEGIDVLQWQFDWENDTPFKVNIWDFGGQEIYHATHQFFLTKRSLYAIITDNRNENDNFYYWFSVVELLADDSPVLLVKNEKGDRQRNLNERELRSQFPQFKKSLATNLATNRGLEAILRDVKHYISQLPHVGDTLPATWVRVRETLENDPRNTISLDNVSSG